MPRISEAILTALWQRAAEEEVGIAIPTNDARALRNKLYAAKPAAEEFEALMTFVPEGLKEVFIVRKSTELPDA